MDKPNTSTPSRPSYHSTLSTAPHVQYNQYVDAPLWNVYLLTAHTSLAAGGPPPTVSGPLVANELQHYLHQTHHPLADSVTTHPYHG